MSAKQKILVVVESIDVEDSSGAKANLALITNLQSAGYHLKVVHYTRKDIQISGIECVAVKENRRSLYFYLSRLERQIRYILKIKLSKPLENIFGFSFTLFNDRNSIVSALKVLDFSKFDLVLTLSQGGRFRPHHALLKLPHLHNKWMAYIHDPYPMHLYPEPYPWKEPGYKIKSEFMEEVSIKAAFHAFPSKLLMEWMGNYFEGYSKKGVVIPHQILEEQFILEVTPNYFDASKFNIVHSGNLLWGRDPKGLINGYLKFINNIPEAKDESCLMFLGGKNHYTKQLLHYHGKYYNIYVSGNYVPFEETQYVQKKSAVNVILEAKADTSPFLPGKFPHCVLANKPILLLGPPVSESRRLLGEDYRFWSEIDSEEIIADLIGELYRDWKLKSGNLSLNRPDLENYLSGDHLRSVVNIVFQKIEA